MELYGAGLYGAELYGVTTYNISDYNTGRDMSYNPIREEIFISRTSALTYVFGKNGLTSIPAEIIDIAYNRDILLVHSPAAIVQDDITFSTDIINFGTQGLKALEWINLEADIADDIFVTVRYRDSIKNAFVSAPTKQFNDEGVCRIGVRGVDFILDFSIPDYTNVQLNLMSIGVQFVDRRFRRGVNIESVRR